MNLGASHPEYYYGFYSFKSKDFSIEFLLDEQGISNLRLDSKGSMSGFRYNDLGQFGNTALLEISSEEDETRVVEIKLLILLNDNKVELVTGYYAVIDRSQLRQMRTFGVKDLKAITMRFVPLEKYEKRKSAAPGNKGE
jgi:hypothetical protein